MNRLIRNVVCWIDGSLRWSLRKPFLRCWDPIKTPSNGLLLGHFSAQSAEKMETEIQWMITNSNAWSSSWVSNFSSKLAGKKRRCWKHISWLFPLTVEFLYQNTLWIPSNHLELARLGIQWKQKSDYLLFQYVEKAWQTSAFFIDMNFNMRFHELQHEVSWGFDIFKCLLSVSSRDWVYKDHAINVSSLKKNCWFHFH